MDTAGFVVSILAGLAWIAMSYWLEPIFPMGSWLWFLMSAELAAIALIVALRNKLKNARNKVRPMIGLTIFGLGGAVIGAGAGVLLWHALPLAVEAAQPSASEVDLTRLADEAESLSKQVRMFYSDRQRSEPPLRGNEDFDSHIRHSRETVALYEERYGPDVLKLARELDSAGLGSKDLLFYAEHPTNPLGVRKVGQELGAIAARLRKRR